MFKFGLSLEQQQCSNLGRLPPSCLSSPVRAGSSLLGLFHILTIRPGSRAQKQYKMGT